MVQVWATAALSQSSSVSFCSLVLDWAFKGVAAAFSVSMFVCMYVSLRLLHFSSLCIRCNNPILHCRCTTSALWSCWPLHNPVSQRGRTERAPVSTAFPTSFRYVFWLQASHRGAQWGWVVDQKAKLEASLAPSLFKAFPFRPLLARHTLDRTFLWRRSKPWPPFSFFN